MDIVLIALHGGMGENGRIQGDALKVLASVIPVLMHCLEQRGRDGHISKLLAEDVGIKTPKWKRIRKGQLVDKKDFEYPCVVNRIAREVL